MDGNDGYTRIRVYLIPLNYTFKIEILCKVYFNMIFKH